MKLIENWKSAPKMASVVIASLGATLASAWFALPEAAQLAVLGSVGLNGIAATVALTFLATIAGRLVKQPSVSGA